MKRFLLFCYEAYYPEGMFEITVKFTPNTKETTS